jgi:biopolymer transport protein ExbD
VQVQLDCDGKLRYEYALEAVSVVLGYLDEDDRFHRLAGQVALMHRQGHPWQVSLDPSEVSGAGEPGESAEAIRLVAPPVERVESKELPLEKADAMEKKAERSRGTASGDRVSGNTEEVQLPESESPQSASKPDNHPIPLEVTKNGDITVAGTLVPADNNGKLDERRLLAALSREKEVMGRLGKSPAHATILIRADPRTATGNIQQIIRVCQSVGFEKFVLRAARPGNQTEDRVE